MSIQPGTIERPEWGSVYFIPELWNLSKEDPQRERAYRWEDTVLGEMEREKLLGTPPGERGVTKKEARSGAVGYLEHLWKSYSPLYKPYFIGVPYLRIGFPRELLSIGPRKRLKAHARTQSHSIYCPLDMLYRRTMIHEVCHLLAWRDHHGPEFCAALVHLWEQEFGIRESRARWLALAHGVQIA